MENLIKFDDVNNKIIIIRNQNVILDSSVAQLYGVQTKEVNQAIKNNSKKFPEGYVFELKVNEYDALRALAESPKLADNQRAVKNFDRTQTTSQLDVNLEKTRVMPKAFTEKGLYMLATILKSDRAIEATIAIVETFAKLKELTNNIAILNSMEPEVIEPEVIEKTGGLFNEIFFSGLPTSAETSFEFNLGVMKGKRIVKSESEHEVRARQAQVEDTIKTQSKIAELEETIRKITERLDGQS